MHRRMDWSFPVKEKGPVKQISGVTKPEKNFWESRGKHAGARQQEETKGKEQKTQKGEEKKGSGKNSKLETVVENKSPCIYGRL